MESKKDIYNLWIQYTTKNDETFFRQFILGFVQIWEHQLNIDFDKPPLSSTIKSDLGPHLNRLPDELLPAIGKFLIIAKDNLQQGKIQSPEELIETTLLIKCLIVMCRHFDNINTIANYEYISSVIALSINLIQMNYKSNIKPTATEIEFIKSACQLIEVIYDPYLIWRNFLQHSNKKNQQHQQFSNNKNYPNCQLQVEIVPFIYDCFQCDKILSLPEIGINLINTLGSIIAGSQHNGMRAISPATVTILIELISKWECNSSLRVIALKCLAVMAIVLQRTSPEERQIELVTICQFYLAAIQTLLKTDHFLPTKSMDDKWKIASADDDIESYIDVNAFLSFIDNIEIILSDEHSQLVLCNALMESNVFSTMITLMQKVCTWNIDLQSLATCIIGCICFLTRMSPQMCLILRTSKNMKQLFQGLFRMGRPTQKLLKMCLNLAYNDSNYEIIFGDIFIHLIDWLKDMHENEQIFLSDNLTKICLQNSYCKSVVSQERIIKSICESIQNHSLLNRKCVLDLIKLMEEIGKYSISSIELKNIFWLLRKEMDFAYHKQLLQAIAAISLNSISNSVVCNEYFDIRNISDGITVPDIRKWTISGPYGFVFHAWIRFDDLNKLNDNHTDRIGKDSQNYRRIILSMLTNQGTGFEVFLQSSGQIVVGVLTKKEYLAASVPKPLLLDNRWHLITVGITKRSTSYTQILVYIDGIQKLEALFQFVGITEPFLYCTIGSFYHRIRKNSRPSYGSQTSNESSSTTISSYSSSNQSPNSSQHSSKSSGSGFPSFMDRSFLPQIVSQVPKYFTLPLRNTTSRDPNIKNYPIGMQDSVFGEPLCLKGQLGSIVLAEPTTNIKTILDAGYNFASIISQDIEPHDLTSKYIFCYSPSSCSDGLCIDLVPGNKYNGHVMAKFCKTIKIQDSINSIGGIYTLLPILDIITKSKENTQYVFTDNSNGSSKDTSLIGVSPITYTGGGGPGSPIIDDFTDYEIIQSTKYTEWKIMQNSVACFLCLIRYFIQNHEINQEHLLKSNGIEIIGAMLVQCNPMIIDVNVLMGTHLLVECIQNQMNNQNTELLEIVYTELIFNFNIWSKGQFQIIIGHIQYINTMIKDNRKYFRKKFGLQYFLDVIRQYFVIPNNLSPEDGRAIRMSLLDNIKYYIQKELNFKEVGVLLSYISTIKYEHLIIELLELLNNCMKSKGCKDQMFLLLHEPQTAELLYFLFTERSFSNELHSTVITFLNCLLETNCVSRNHKSTLRLHDLTVGSLFPGLFSFMKPFTINNTIIMNLYDQILMDESENKYCALLYLIHHINPTDIDLKLEISRKLLRVTFEQKNAAHLLAQQIGWQESITRLLIKKSINEHIDKVKHSDSYSDFDMSNEEYSTDILNQTDLITFDEKTMELSAYEGAKDHHLLLTEFQASVTEAANVIEHEIKGMAESVAEKVGENISSVYSILRQRTCDIQEQFETAIGGPIDHKLMKSNPSLSTQSSNSTSNENVSIKSTDGKSTDTCEQIESEDDKEKQLIYLVTHILFNILWHGLENENDNKDTWKKRGQVIASINLLVLKNELHCSHVTLRLKILELSIDAMCKSLIESGHNLHHQQNAAQLLRIVYDLVILDSTEDDLNNKCSMVLLDGVLALLDALFVFSSTGNDDWSEMTRLFLGLLIKCSQYPNEDIVAKATARLHAIVQSRTTQNSDELAYLIYSINKPLNASIEIAQPEQYSFLIPVMRTLLHRSRSILSLGVNLPDLPSTTSGPIFFNDFQMYICSKQWINFVDKKMKPLHDSYQADVNNTITEPLNIFWAECYESYKMSSQKRIKYLTECRLKFKHKIALPWRIRQTEEINRLNGILSSNKIKENQFERRWKSIKRFLHGPRGAWSYNEQKEDFWQLSNHENSSRMRPKLKPSLYHDSHTVASNIRDNTSGTDDTRRLSTEFGSSITGAVIKDILTEDEVITFEEEIKNITENQQQEVPVEKVVISQECELVTLMTRVKGRLEVTNRQFTFIDLNTTREDGDDKLDFKFPLSNLKELHLRKYNLRRSALEIFLVDQTSYFLNFTIKIRNKIFTKILSLQPPNIINSSGRSPSEQLKASGLMQKWMNRELSNFEYLMHLNTIAGRTYNDLSQYPIFPWILQDYTSEILDLTNPRSYRDLSKPIGVLSAKNEKEVRAKYESFEDPSGVIPPFHYGTHYSNSASVLHYLLRVEPFTSLHIELQSGKFDLADRQFHSIPQTFKLLMDNANDVKELIPEFFYFPEFLKNMNKFDLGVLQITKERVDDVVLPPWANTPEDFIEIHRRALESEYVSQNLHHWIDLIFGYKQKGKAAVDALNIFSYYSYEGAVDLDKIENQTDREAYEGMINNFGQVPSQLLRESHPKRLTPDETIVKLIRMELRKPDLTNYLDRIVSVVCELSTDKDPSIFINLSRLQTSRSFFNQNPDILVSISKSGILGCNSWISFDKEKGFLLEIDATTTNLKNRKKINGPFHPATQIHSQLFAVSLDGRHLYAGGIWDNALKVFSVNRGRNVASITHHLDIITCIALDNCGSFLVTGSKDCTCIIWSISNISLTTNTNVNLQSQASTSGAVTGYSQLNTNNSLTPGPLHTLYGHESSVTCVAIMTELDIIVSGSMDGTVNVHTIMEGQYVRTLMPKGCSGIMTEIAFITISYQGHIAFSALDDTSHSVHAYSINGSHLGSKYVSGRVTGITTANDFLIVSDDAGDITLSRLYGLKPVLEIPLYIPIQTIIVTPGNTHILAPLRDGKLAVIGLSSPNAYTKKHTILNV